MDITWKTREQGEILRFNCAMTLLFNAESICLMLPSAHKRDIGRGLDTQDGQICSCVRMPKSRLSVIWRFRAGAYGKTGGAESGGHLETEGIGEKGF